MAKSVVYMFPGQGSHYHTMARELYRGSLLFRQTMDRLDAIAAGMIGESLVERLYRSVEAGEPFQQTLYTHPAIFMVQYALAQVLMAEGLTPCATVGCSVGEFAAAAVAGGAPAEELLEAVIVQARTLVGHGCSGSMLAILHDPALYRSEPVLHDNVELVSVNYDSHFVVSGALEKLKEVGAFLGRERIASQALPVSCAFHSSLIDPAGSSYRSYLAKRNFLPPSIPLVSSLTGTVLETFPSSYFWDVIRKPILFRQALRELEEEEGGRIYLDLGPGGTLCHFVKKNLPAGSRSEAFAVITPYHREMKTLGELSSMIKKTTSTRRTEMVTYIFPGQGSQQKGMGGGLFDEFPDLVAKADRVLGYSIKELCLEDRQKQLVQTQFTQPALYVVNALSYLKKVRETGKRPDYVAGHSLGEYNALFAAGAFDFETGLKLVQKRGALMSQATGGGMAAVMGVGAAEVEEILRGGGIDTVDIANLNAPSQTVLAGPKQEIMRIAPLFEEKGIVYIPLNVSGAFHSRYMEPSQQEFAAFIGQFAFSPLEIPVISNVEARPYRGDVKDNLVRQITHSVQWIESIRYLMGKGVDTFEEVGPGTVLTSLVATIRRQTQPLVVADEEVPSPAPAPEQRPGAAQSQEGTGAIAATSLGSCGFRADYNLKYAYLAGSMYRGISSEEMVVKLGKAGMLGFWGAGGMDTRELKAAVQYIQEKLSAGEPYGVNLLHNPNDPSREEQKVDILLKYGVKTVEASAYLSITPALVRYRAHGLRRDADGIVSGATRIIAKISRPEIAEMFLAPAPERVVEKLVQEQKLTREQAALLREIPVADDLCAEADSGGHTDGGVAYALLPAIQKLRDELVRKYGYRKEIRVGAAGGIGTPEAAAAAYVMGADFIVTGSINQCTVEARTSEAVKDMLQSINVQDTDYAPAGDMFELGAKVQVMKRGVFFPSRANKLHELYRRYNSIDDIDGKTRKMLEEKYFKRSFDDIYQEMLRSRTPEGELTPKQKLALVFQWYFRHSTQAALEGSKGHEVDYQVQCGPALGAFNQWTKGTGLENWRNRKVDEIGEKLMVETAELLQERFRAFASC